MIFTILKFATFLLLAHLIQALVTELVIENKFISPDGYNRSATVVNGVHPGPVLTAYKNELLDITVSNGLTDNKMTQFATVHYHGILQKQSPEYDGVPMVTQCPIVPGESFQNVFIANDQAGTFWYHSHESIQYCNGLRGPLIIYDPEDPYRFLYDVDDESTIITLADWYQDIVQPASNGGAYPAPTSTLINGKGRYSSGPEVDLAVINVDQGKRYRFRVINMACESYFIFSIAQHLFYVIEADGINTQPVEADSLTIYAGERYSIVVTANQPVNNYAINAVPELYNKPTYMSSGKAILRYKGAPEVEPTSYEFVSEMPLDESKLPPLVDPAAPGKPNADGADVYIYLENAYDPTKEDGFTINGAPFEPPNSASYLMQALSGAHTKGNFYPDGTVYPVPSNAVIEITIGALAAGGPHPFHLHGHTFSIIKSANHSDFNYENPPRRDTVNTGMEGNVTIRFTTDNTGPWVLHCHIDPHLDRGMGVTLIENPSGIEKLLDTIPVGWNELCPAYNNSVAGGIS